MVISKSKSRLFSKKNTNSNSNSNNTNTKQKYVNKTNKIRLKKRSMMMSLRGGAKTVINSSQQQKARRFTLRRSSSVVSKDSGVGNNSSSNSSSRRSSSNSISYQKPKRLSFFSFGRMPSGSSNNEIPYKFNKETFRQKQTHRAQNFAKRIATNKRGIKWVNAAINSKSSNAEAKILAEEFMGRQLLRAIQKQTTNQKKEQQLIAHFENQKKKEIELEKQRQEEIELQKYNSYRNNPYVSLLGSKSNKLYNTNNVIV